MENLKFLKRRSIAILLSMAIVLTSSGVLFFQEWAEERRIIAEERRLREEAEAERQAAIDFIEERIQEGYNDWTELIAWADNQNIAWYLSENGERASVDLMEDIMTYGISGNYLGAMVDVRDEDNPDNIALLLNFENLSYQEAIAELSELDTSSFEELDNWLENGGLERIEEAFYNVTIVDNDGRGVEITEEPEFGKEFVSWSFVTSDALESFENSSLRIVRRYMLGRNPLFTASNEEIQQAVIDALNEADKEVFREVRGFSSEQEFIAELLGVEPTVIFEVRNQGVRRGNRTTTVSVQRLDRVGNRIFTRRTTEDIFLYWDFIYEVDDDGILKIIISHHFDIEVD